MNSIQEYLSELKAELKGSDSATVQDALADAEEYLVDALEALRETKAALTQEEAINQVIAEYGSPREIAAAYLEAEQRLMPNLPRRKNMKEKSLIARFFGVFADPITWGSLLFILVSMVTGTAFFTWVITGFSLSVSFLIFIFGLFFLLFFLYSLRGIALVEGKFVEALLGTRMPHRPMFAPKNLRWQEQLKLLLKEKHTWLTLIYTVLKLPISVFFFTVVIALLSGSLSLIAVPILWFGFPTIFPMYVSHLPEIQSAWGFLGQNWMMVVYGLLGILALTATMHAAKGTGILQAKWAKLMLVVD